MPRVDSPSIDILTFAEKLHDRVRPDRALGQVFTPAGVARYMASLFQQAPTEYSLLDPGAGLGVLTAAVAERIAVLPPPRSLSVQLFEPDLRLIPLLTETMEQCRQRLAEVGHAFEYQIQCEDFIETFADAFRRQRSLLGGGSPSRRFDGVIMNPPYFKLNKDSMHARLMVDVVHGQPNMYALFLALGADLLKAGGELVAITPRSFCNGLYFRGFRRWFFERMGPRHIHLFESRVDTFRESKVLQESVVTASVRLGVRPAKVTVTRSSGRILAGDLSQEILPIQQLLDDSCGDMVLRIPERSNDARILEIAEGWEHRFSEQGLAISTGPVVTFRAKEFLLAEANGTHSAPLLSVHNVRPFQTVWPVKKKGKPEAFRVTRESMKHLLPTRNYVLVRRFSAKEERRRLTASWLLRRNEDCPFVALENHLNYVYHARRELSEEEVFGLTALFNSALLDRYFRTLSGNTQVNATEIRTMRFPALATASRIGRQIASMEGIDAVQIESIVLRELEIEESIQRYLLTSFS